MAIEEPAFTTLAEEQGFSVREYAPRVVAETAVEGTLGTASSGGFRRLAGYIFGNNRPASGAAQKIAMTAPVTVDGGGTRWRVQFTMPAAYTLATLPRPGDPAVTLHQRPRGRFAVVRFTGLAGEERFREQSARLLAWMGRRGLVADGEAALARYNPPWTLPFLRRNEVLIPCR